VSFESSPLPIPQQGNRQLKASTQTNLPTQKSVKNLFALTDHSAPRTQRQAVWTPIASLKLALCASGASFAFGAWRHPAVNASGEPSLSSASSSLAAMPNRYLFFGKNISRNEQEKSLNSSVF
jgi:hypothetical protein